MQFYELADEVDIPGRWHLGEVLTRGGTEPRLRAGLLFSERTTLSCDVHKPGRVLEFSLTSFAVPIVTRALADAVRAIAGDDVQWLPVEVSGQAGFEVLNAVRLIECLDETRSTFTKWTADDDRPDVLGDYEMVIDLAIRPDVIPPGIHVFRIARWQIALVVSAEVKRMMEAAGCRGARFTKVT